MVFALLFQVDLVFRTRFDSEGLNLSLGYGPFRRQLVPAKKAALSPEEEEKAEKEAEAKKTAKEKKAAKKAAKKPKTADAAEEAAAEHKKGDIRGMVELVLALVKAALPPVGKMLTGFRLKKLRLFIRVGGANAAETAVRYGQVCALVHGGLTALQSLLPIEVKEVGIGYDFLHSGIEEEITFELRLRLGRLLGQTFRLLGRAIVRGGRALLKQKKQAPPKKVPAKAEPAAD